MFSLTPSLPSRLNRLSLSLSLSFCLYPSVSRPLAVLLSHRSDCCIKQPVPASTNVSSSPCIVGVSVVSVWDALLYSCPNVSGDPCHTFKL
ncbi:hypothetical protein QQF64_022576 [Cirrhinus molitorella]|uniref:Secreted protein n=1 Tax=Cirrhinus molitorella TaxID=172907 RepID=A0ABR3L4D9_9TELE